MAGELGFEIGLTAQHDKAIELVTDALKAEGFGVITRTDIDKAFKEKIGEDFRSYTILGACSPKLAHAALTSNPEIGLMLPCNVTVEASQTGSGSVVRIVNPAGMMQMGDLGTSETIRGVAKDAGDRLKRVVESLQKMD